MLVSIVRNCPSPVVAPASMLGTRLPRSLHGKRSEPARVGFRRVSDEYGGIDGLTRWLGLRWEAADTIRLTIRPELINPAGLLAGPVAYAMVDYSMGSALWEERSGTRRGERSGSRSTTGRRRAPATSSAPRRSTAATTARGHLKTGGGPGE